METNLPTPSARVYVYVNLLEGKSSNYGFCMFLLVIYRSSFHGIITYYNPFKAGKGTTLYGDTQEIPSGDDEEFANLKMAIEIVDLPINNGVLQVIPEFFVCLPEGMD